MWLILLMWTVDIRIIYFPWGNFLKIRGIVIKQSGRKLDSKRLGTRWVGASKRSGSDWSRGKSDRGVSLAERAIEEQGIGEQGYRWASKFVRKWSGSDWKEEYSKKWMRTLFLWHSVRMSWNSVALCRKNNRWTQDGRRHPWKCCRIFPLAVY